MEKKRFGSKLRFKKEGNFSKEKVSEMLQGTLVLNCFGNDVSKRTLESDDPPISPEKRIKGRPTKIEEAGGTERSPWRRIRMAFRLQDVAAMFTSRSLPGP